MRALLLVGAAVCACGLVRPSFMNGTPNNFKTVDFGGSVSKREGLGSTMSQEKSAAEAEWKDSNLQNCKVPTDALKTLEGALIQEYRLQSVLRQPLLTVNVHIQEGRYSEKDGFIPTKVRELSGSMFFNAVWQIDSKNESRNGWWRLSRFIPEGMAGVAEFSGVLLHRNEYNFELEGCTWLRGIWSYVFQIKPLQKSTGGFLGQI